MQSTQSYLCSAVIIRKSYTTRGFFAEVRGSFAKVFYPLTSANFLMKAACFAVSSSVRGPRSSGTTILKHKHKHKEFFKGTWPGGLEAPSPDRPEAKFWTLVMWSGSLATDRPKKHAAAAEFKSLSALWHLTVSLTDHARRMKTWSECSRCSECFIACSRRVTGRSEAFQATVKADLLSQGQAEPLVPANNPWSCASAS